MTVTKIDLDRLLAKSQQSILERTLMAEYLFSKGYLTQELGTLPLQAADRLIAEARRFANLRMVEIEGGTQCSWWMRLPISLN